MKTLTPLQSTLNNFAVNIILIIAYFNQDRQITYFLFDFCCILLQSVIYSIVRILLY